MAAYSATDKFLHRVYLGNYPLSRASMEIEEILFGPKIKALAVKQSVFVTGLARSGTTAVMRALFDTGAYASLQYSNMPFLLSPNLWKRSSQLSARERAHQDGIRIDGNSPEEFDEYFWKAQCRDAYIKEARLEVHPIADGTLEKYRRYIKLVCLSKGRHQYLSKNNNNILRLAALRKIDGYRLVVLFREPLNHAASLRKLHLGFSASQKEDPFSLEFFDFLGHHEFGLHHKPFALTEEFERHSRLYEKDSLNYWLAIWLNYYGYLLSQDSHDLFLLGFEDLISRPGPTYEALFEYLQLPATTAPEGGHTPPAYKHPEVDAALLGKCEAVYARLNALKTYAPG